MKKNALLDLYAGCVTPWDRNILSDMALPSDVVDPFASQDTDPIAIMNLTFVSLKGWIEDAKKADYFSERFVDLSKLVMKGVTTMGRGLVTLHNRGEDLSAAPMKIEDLISVGSYHFRKSYLGVVQFSAKRPEIGERLLLNQLRWADMLLRLYKTKEKLSEKPGIRSNRPEIKDGGDTDAAKAKLGGQENTVGQLSAASPFDSLDTLFVDRSQSLASHSSLNEPAAFSAQRALSGFNNSAGRTQQAAGSKQQAVSSAQQAVASSEKNEPAENKNSAGKTQQAAGSKQQAVGGSQQTAFNSEKDQAVGNKISAGRTQQAAVSEQCSADSPEKDEPAENENSVSSAQQTTGSTEKDEKAENKNSAGSAQQADISKKKAARDPENLIPDPVKNEPDPRTINPALPEDPLIPAHPAPDTLPETVKIMQNAIRRSEANGDGMLAFTIAEMRVLAADPIFADMEPDLVTDIRNTLAKYDSG